MYFNFGGCFQLDVISTVLLQWDTCRCSQHDYSYIILLFPKTISYFCFLFRSVSPDLKSFAVGIETLGGRVLGKTSYLCGIQVGSQRDKLKLANAMLCSR